MIIYVIIQYVLIVVATIFIGYQLLLGLFALMPQHKPEQAAFNHSFLLVIHSHNNEQEIIKTLYSLYGLVYPWNLFELLVIADNCTDNTAKVARKFGARVLERNNAHHKPLQDTFHWAVEQIWFWDDEYDAIVVINPGGLISGNFLKVMNRYLKKGSKVLQSRNLKITHSDPWRIKYIRIACLLENHINALGRKKMGLGIKLTGSGICFKTNVLKNTPIELSQAIDDWSYSMPLLMKGIQIDFAPEAVVWSPLHDSSEERKSLKTKLGMGQFQMKKKYIKQIMNRLIDNKSLRNFDTLISFLTPPLMTLIMGSGGMALLNWGLWKLGYISGSLFWMWIILFGMMIIYLLIGIVTDRSIFRDLSSDFPKNDLPGFTGS